LGEFKDNNKDLKPSHINVNNKVSVGHESIVITAIIMFLIITIAIFIALKRKNRKDSELKPHYQCIQFLFIK
jgi:large-conductance mechanosensitive channel